MEFQASFSIINGLINLDFVGNGSHPFLLCDVNQSTKFNLWHLISNTTQEFAKKIEVTAPLRALNCIGVDNKKGVATLIGGLQQGNKLAIIKVQLISK